MIARLVDALVRRLASIEAARPRTVLATVAMIALVAGAVAARRLELRTRYDQLLPDGAPSAVELARLTAHVDGAQTMLVVLQGDDPKAVRALGDAIVARVGALGPGVVSSVADGVQRGRAFLQPRAGLFLSQGELSKMRAEVDERWDREVARQTGESLDDDDPAPAPTEWTDAKLRERLGAGGADRFPDGYWARKDGKALVVVVRSPVPAGDLARTKDAVARISAAVGAVAASEPAIHVGYAGDMIAGLDEYQAIRSDLLGVGAAGVALVLGVVFLYFMRVRALLLIGANIAVGLALTFGAAAVAIGHLNVATGFLFSIVAGNGINASIIYLARYEEERAAGADARAAIRVAHLATWPATAMAAFAAAASYASLAATKFPAFHEFAFIGASGMIACWLATLAVVPSLLVVIDDGPRAARRGIPYGSFFAWAATRASRPLVVLGLLVTVSGSAACAAYVASRPLEYDMRHIQTDVGRNAARNQAWDVATEILGQSPQAAVVLTRTPAEARELQRTLSREWAHVPEHDRPLGAVHTIFDFVPDDQDQKLPDLLAIAARARRAHELGLLSDDEWRSLAPVLPPPDLAPFGLDDLPPELAGPFTEKSGRRGTIVLIEPAPGQNQDDLRYLMRYADAFREVRLPSGAVVRGAGRAVVFADILEAVVHDMPVAVAVSLATTVLAVLLALRRSAVPVLASLLVALAGLALFLLLGGVRINFLNFAALPITFGIGVDYAVNVMQRHRAAGGGDIAGTLRTSGGAVVLCSLTTTLGYFALLGSHNQAIRSFGAIAVAGEVCCLLAATLVLPAALHLGAARR
jgi:predicted RND superfamily exporter protein